MTKQVRAWHLDQFKCRVDDNLVLANATLDIDILGKLTCVKGPNGGGKSTVVKLFTGHLHGTRFKFEGDAYLETVGDDHQSDLLKLSVKTSPWEISKFGIEYVSQEPIIPAYAHWSDIFVAGQEGSLFRPPNPSAAQDTYQCLANAHGLEFHSRKPKGDWARADLQRFAILRALARLRRGGLLVFDEATASLPEVEAVRLLTTLRDRVLAGDLSFVFVSHRPGEIALADQILEVRHGRVFEAQLDPAAVTNLQLTSNSPVLALSMRLATGHSIALKQGDVSRLQLGSAAEENALLDALISRRAPILSQLVLFGADHTRTNVQQRRVAGLRLIPGDRTKHGIFGDLTARENIAIEGQPGREFSRVNWKKAEAQGERFSVTKYQMAADARHLSGGLKQRLLFARELDAPNARVLIAFNALQGLDVSFIPRLVDDLHRFAAAGGAVLLVGA